MTTPIRLNQHDMGIKLTFHCRDESGLPINLEQFLVDFSLYDDDTLINKGRTTCAKPDAALGVAEYTVQAADTASAGLLYGKLRIHNADFEIKNLGTIPIEIEEAV
ncbi:MAG: hypothetical protein ACE15F_13650 [bacterium]